LTQKTISPETKPHHQSGKKKIAHQENWSIAKGIAHHDGRSI
jgi:hypothetical protein